MKLVVAAQMRELDRRTVEEGRVKGEVLMDRAGEGVAMAVRRMAEAAGFPSPLIHLIAGRGNNGGDAFAAARRLKQMGFEVEVWLAGGESQVTGDARLHLTRMKAAKIGLSELPSLEDWQDAIRNPCYAEIVVDGVLGIGLEGPARGPAAGAIQYINSQANDALVVAIDVPSGLSADTGRAEGDAVLADLTVTMGLPKLGLVEPAAREHVGSMEVVDIGIPAEFVQDASTDAGRELIYASDLKPLFPRRRRTTHKGDYGHVLLIGGSPRYAGAIAMAARSALRSGVGLVTALVPEGLEARVGAGADELMVLGGKTTTAGTLSAANWMDIRERAEDFTAILVGPGLTLHPETLPLVRNIIRESPVPLVLDADAISILAGQADYLSKARYPAVITPHPGELARLLGQRVEDIQADRIGAATAAAELTRSVVVLKGAGTVVAHAGRPVGINLTGNPGMATGGMGDVLAGLLAGLLAQKFHPCDAASAAVYLHGRAGDLAAWRKCQTGLIAGDVIDELPFALRELTLR